MLVANGTRPHALRDALAGTINYDRGRGDAQRRLRRWRARQGRSRRRWKESLTKTQRQHRISELIDRDVISTAAQIVARLHEEGIAATQATVTRDLQELGTVKVRDEHGTRRIVIAASPKFAPAPARPPAAHDGRVGRLSGELGQPGRGAHATGLRPRRRLGARPQRPARRARLGRRRRHPPRDRRRTSTAARQLAEEFRVARGTRVIRPSDERKGQTMTKRVVLAYSGGLDTSVAVRWMIEEWGVEVVCVLVDVGQDVETSESFEDIRARALAAGALECVVVDAETEMAEEFCAKAIAANARYEGKYPLVSALSRPVIVRHLVDQARQASTPRPSPTAAPARATTRCASRWAPTRSPPTSRCSRPRATGA